jgi:hypothetical protein
VSRSIEQLATRIRVGLPLSGEELATLDRAARETQDIGSWLLLRADRGEALAALVSKDLADVPERAIIRGACELRGAMRHSAWHVLAGLAEERPQAVAAIEEAIASWPARSRPWMRT